MLIDTPVYVYTSTFFIHFYIRFFTLACIQLSV